MHRLLLTASCALLPVLASAQEAAVPTEIEQRLQYLEETIAKLQAEKAAAVRVVAGIEPVADAMKKDDKAKKDDDKSRLADEGIVVGSDTSFKASWKDGLIFKSPYDDYRMHIGGRFDIDSAFFAAGSELQKPISQGGVGKLDDGAVFRRLRVRMDGQAYEIIEWLLEVDFASASEPDRQQVAPTDVYIDLTQLPVVGNFRVGHFREPFSMEDLTSGMALTFLERSNLWEAFDPFRNLGAMFFDTVLDDRASWAIGIFRTNSQNRGDAFDYGDGEYAVTGRVTALPWYEQDGRCLLHLGAHYSHRSFVLNPTQDRVRFRSFPETRVGRYIFADSGSFLAESVDMGGLELGLNLGSFNFQSECIAVQANNAIIQNQFRDPFFYGWYAQVSYYLTGENKTYRRYIGQRTVGVFDKARQNEDFFLVRGSGWRNLCIGHGAWEIAARFSSINVSDPSQGVNAQQLRDVTLGLNWYLNYNTKFQFNYIIAARDFEAANNDAVAHILAMRVHYDF